MLDFLGLALGVIVVAGAVGLMVAWVAGAQPGAWWREWRLRQRLQRMADADEAAVLSAYEERWPRRRPADKR